MKKEQRNELYGEILAIIVIVVLLYFIVRLGFKAAGL